MWLALTLGGGRNELNLKWGRSTISRRRFISKTMHLDVYRAILLIFSNTVAHFREDTTINSQRSKATLRLLPRCFRSWEADHTFLGRLRIR